MLVNLSSFPILSQQSSQNPLTPHPKNLARHPRLRGTLPLSGPSMPPFSLCGQQQSRARTGVNNRGFNNDPTILDEFLNVCSGVGIANFSLLGGIEPDFALADVGDAGSEPLLRP